MWIVFVTKVKLCSQTGPIEGREEAYVGYAWGNAMGDPPPALLPTIWSGDSFPNAYIHRCILLVPKVKLG